MKIRTALSSKPRGLIVAFLAAGAMVLTGCQSGGDPVAEPTSTSTVTSTTPTPTPTPTSTAAYKPADPSGKAQNVPVPVKPALADENSKEGLEAFTKYWFELLSYGYETGNTTVIRTLSAAGCEVCVGLQDVIGQMWGEGRWLSGATISTPSVEAHFNPAKSTQEVTLQVIQQEMRVHRADGSLYQDATPLQNNGSQLVATYIDSRWQVVELGLIR